MKPHSKNNGGGTINKHVSQMATNQTLSTPR